MHLKAGVNIFSKFPVKFTGKSFLISNFDDFEGEKLPAKMSNIHPCVQVANHAASPAFLALTAC